MNNYGLRDILHFTEKRKIGVSCFTSLDDGLSENVGFSCLGFSVDFVKALQCFCSKEKLFSMFSHKLFRCQQIHD